MKIEQLIEDERLKLVSDSYQMSIGELAHLYTERELTIDPDFQRELRWLDSQKVMFIESILLQFPLPSIFVASRPNGTWDLLDGLQRVSTIFQFMGILRNENDQPVKPLQLTATERFPSLAGLYFNSEFGDLALSEKFQMEFKRHRLDVKIILRQSNPDMLYDLFTRLAIGGTQLTNQDVRNAFISRNDSAFRHWLDELVRNSHFENALTLSDSDLKQRYNYELALVFLLLANDSDEEISDILDLDEALNALVRKGSRLYDYDRDVSAQLFDHVFALLDRGAPSTAFEPKALTPRLVGLNRGAFAAITAACLTAIRNGEQSRLDEIIARYWNLDPLPETFAQQVKWGRSINLG